MKRWGFLLAGLAVCLLLAGVVSNFASSSPDGLEHAAREGCTEYVASTARSAPRWPACSA
jgi:hypothetical protein